MLSSLMAPALPTIESRVERETIGRAIDSLVKWMRSRAANREAQLIEHDDFIYVVVTLKKIPERGRTSAYRIPIPHPLYPLDPLSPFTPSIFLIADDSPKSRLSPAAARAAAAAAGVPLSDVVGVSDLRADYKPYEARRRLCDSHDLFFADRRLIPLLPRLLGKTFFKKKKLPIAIDLSRKSWPDHLRQCCTSTLLHLRCGTCSGIKIGRLSQDRDEIVDNAAAAIEGAVQYVPRKWANVRSLHVKSADSLALPIYQVLPQLESKITNSQVSDKKKKKAKKEKEIKVSDSKKKASKKRISIRDAQLAGSDLYLTQKEEDNDDGIDEPVDVAQIQEEFSMFFAREGAHDKISKASEAKVKGRKKRKKDDFCEKITAGEGSDEENDGVAEGGEDTSLKNVMEGAVPTKKRKSKPMITNMQESHRKNKETKKEEKEKEKEKAITSGDSKKALKKRVTIGDALSTFPKENGTDGNHEQTFATEGIYNKISKDSEAKVERTKKSKKGDDSFEKIEAREVCDEQNDGVTEGGEASLKNVIEGSVGTKKRKSKSRKLDSKGTKKVKRNKV